MNGKSSPKKTKPRALNHVQSDMNDVGLNRTPPTITHSVLSAMKKNAVADVNADAESRARVDYTQPKKRKTLVSANEGAPVRKKIPKTAPPPATKKEPPEESSYDDSDDEDDDEDDEDVDPAVAMRGHAAVTVGVDDDSDDESDLEEASRARKRKKQRWLYQQEAMENEEKRSSRVGQRRIASHKFKWRWY